ncbi:conserved protein of unknown function (plasmid) [Enterobacter cancerogenus]|nr:conserved protein of unknown function [Enterobacter cancerogenus]
MQAEVLYLGVFDERQIANFDIGCQIVAFEHSGHFSGVVGQLATARDLVLALLLALMPQNPRGDKEGDDADHGGNDGREDKSGPDLVSTPDNVLVLQQLLRVVLQFLAVVANGVNGLGPENIAHRGKRLAPVPGHAVDESLPRKFHGQRQGDDDPEENNEAVQNDVGDLAEHADAHARDLTALGHILGIKTHDVGPVVCAVTLAAKAKYSGVAGNPL